jgi:WD40 repeat protein
MYSFALGTTEIVKSDDPGASFFELLTGTVTHGPGIQGADTAAIVGMDVCVWKPLLATCGRDHTVRIWNTIERTVEVTKRFSEEPLSVALHPSGLFLLVGFTDRVRLLSLLMDDMRTVKELNVKQCRTLSFSKGGHLFAMANQSAVQVLDTHTCAMVLQLRGHQQVVRSIMWTDRDRKISTIGKDGNVFLWDVRSGARVHESMQPRTSFTAACLAGHDYANSGGLTSSSRLFTLASDLTIRSFIATTLTPENQVQSDMEINCMLAAPNGRALFVGTAVPGQPGLLVSYIMKDARFPGTTSAQANAAANALALSGSDSGPGDARRAAASSTDKQQAAPPAVAGAFPPAPSVSTVESQVVVAHSSPMTSMCLSTDGSTLYTGGEDGSLCIFDVREVDARGVVKLQAASTAKLAAEQGGKGESGVGGGGGGHKAEQYASEILVTKEELVTKKKLSDELQGKVEELKLSSEHQLQLKDMQHQERVKDVTDKFTAELQECERNFEGLKSSKDALETSYVTRLEALHANNEAELNMRQEQYRVKIETERLRKDALFEERKRQTAEWSASNTRTVSEQKNEVGKLTSDYEKKLEVEQLAQSNLHGEKEQVEAAWDVTRVRIEQDGDLEVEEIKLKYEARLKLEQEITMKLKKEHAEMKKRYQVLVKEVKEQDDAIKGLNVLEKQLRDVLKGLEKDIVGHKKEVRM